jgi:isoleucyl-tRNA synthetase
LICIKNVVDEITLVSGKPMKREALIDVWFDSGSMPCNGIILLNKDKIDENKDFPADFIAGVDQTRGWFYTLLEP